MNIETSVIACVDANLILAEDDYRIAMIAGSGPETVLSKLRLEFARCLYAALVAYDPSMRAFYKRNAHMLHAHLRQSEFNDVQTTENHVDLACTVTKSLRGWGTVAGLIVSHAEHHNSRARLLSMVFGSDVFFGKRYI